jgi:hypothetical protein
MMRLTNVMVMGAVCALGLAGCADEGGKSDKLSWEQFRADAEKKIEVGGEQKTIYVVDGDIPVSLEELRRQYQLYLEHVPGVSPRSTVNLTGGQRDIWHGQQEQNLTYCVSNTFGANKERAVREMHEAGVAWELAADVRFTYVPGHDGNATATTPTPPSSSRCSRGTRAARAPSSPRATRASRAPWSSTTRASTPASPARPT